MKERFGYIALALVSLMAGQGCDTPSRTDKGRFVTLGEVMDGFSQHDQALLELAKKVIAEESEIKELQNLMALRPKSEAKDKKK